MSPFEITLLCCAFALVFAASLYAYVRVRNAWTQRDMELVRARALVEIVSVLNGTTAQVRDKMKRATRVLSNLGDQQGWRCRVVLHADPGLLPPSGAGLGFHLPIEVNEHAVGTLIVSRGPHQFTPSETEFFEALRRCLAAFIYRERRWDDFHSHLERVQASLLLGIDTTPEQAVGHVNQMLSVLKET